MLLGIPAHVTAYDEARSIVDRLVAALPSGSYLVANDGKLPDEIDVFCGVGR
jgi:hypothetical protein